MPVFYTHAYQSGSNIRLRLCDSYGNRRFVDKKYTPELFVRAMDPKDACEFTGLNGEPLERIKFKSFWEMRDYIEENKDVRGFELFGQDDFVSQFITKNFRGNIDFDWRHIKIANVDIEVVSGYRTSEGEIHDGPFPEPTINEFTFKDDQERERYIESIKANSEWLSREFPGTVIPPVMDMNAAFPITLIQLSTTNNVTGDKKMLVWGLPDSNFRGKYEETGEYEGGYKCEYYEFTTEQELLSHFLAYWYRESFDGWTGWNIETFDNPYLHERIRKILGPENVVYLSPWKDVRSRTYKDGQGGKATKFIFNGCEMLDYIELYKKHRLITREKYSLDHIAYVELKERKVDYTEAKTLTRLYFNDYCKYVNYGKKDIRLVDRLDDLLKYLRLSFALAYKAKCNYSDTTGTVQPWTCLMGWFLHERGLKQKRRKQETEAPNFEGGYVKDVIPGFYRWLISVDLNSLYPHIIQQYNLGVETIVSEEVRLEILFDLAEEIRIAMVKETDFSRKTALRNLMKKVQAQSNDIVDELVAVGHMEFEVLKRHNVSMTPNLQFFSNHKMSVLSEIMRLIYGERKGEKKQMQVFEQREVWAKQDKEGHFQVNDEVKAHRAFGEDFLELLEKQPIETVLGMMKAGIEEHHTFQYGLKILMNAGYGAITNIWFRDFYDIRIGEGICAAGRLINKWNIHNVNLFMNEQLGTKGKDYVPYGDTDSNYICLDPIVQNEGFQPDQIKDTVDFLDKYHKEVLAPRIEEYADTLCKTVNGFEQRMFWEREVIAQTAVWQAPKLYIMAVNNSEGTAYETPKIKMTGVAAKKSDYPEWCRDRMKQVYKICLLGKESELKEYVQNVREEYKALPPHEIAAPTAVNNIEKWLTPNGWWADGTPWHVRASISYNNYLKENPIDGLKPIKSGDKVLTIKVKEESPLAYKSFAFHDYLPEEWNLEEYIDRETILYGNFLKPIELILSKMGWTHDNRHNFLRKKDEEVDPTQHRGLSRAQKMGGKGGKRKVVAETKAKRLW